MTGATSWRCFIKRRKKVKTASRLFTSLFVAAIAALPAFAQAAEGGKPPEHVAKWIVLAAGFSMALAASFCGIAQSRVAAAACEGMARNPAAAGAIRTAMILGLVFIETLALFTLAIVFAKVNF
jgi:F-type H+-transporting ATPase subunit c